MPLFSFTLRTKYDTNPFACYSIIFIFYYFVTSSLEKQTNTYDKLNLIKCKSEFTSDPNLIVSYELIDFNDQKTQSLLEMSYK